MSRYTARLRSPGELALALQQARLEQGLTQLDLARELGVTQSAISALENGRPTIQLIRLFEYARTVGLELSGAWGEADVTEGPSEASN